MFKSISAIALLLIAFSFTSCNLSDDPTPDAGNTISHDSKLPKGTDTTDGGIGNTNSDDQ